MDPKRQSVVARAQHAIRCHKLSLHSAWHVMWLQWQHHFEKFGCLCFECSDCARGWHGKLSFMTRVVKPLKLIEGRASHGTGRFASGVFTALRQDLCDRMVEGNSGPQQP